MSFKINQSSGTGGGEGGKTAQQISSAPSNTKANAAAITEMRRAVYNALYYKDLTVTEGDSEYGIGDGPIDRQDPAACSDVQNAIQTLGDIVTDAGFTIREDDTNELSDSLKVEV